MEVNLDAIRELREGLTGPALAAHILRSIQLSAAKVPNLEDRKSQEIGLLTYELRKLCDLLAIAVEDPASDEAQEAQENIDERTPLSDRLEASIAAYSRRNFDRAAADRAAGMQVEVL